MRIKDGNEREIHYKGQALMGRDALKPAVRYRFTLHLFVKNGENFTSRLVFYRQM